MNGTLTDGTDGKIENPKSDYQPSEAIKLLAGKVMEAYQDGEAVMTAPYKEYNNRSFVDQANESQRTWLSHPDAPYEGEDEWRWNGVRPITRNRVIYTAARLTSKLLRPSSTGQNDQQEEDREAGYAMDTLIEHNIRTSNYETAFLFGVINGLINPLNFFSVEYCESWLDAWNGDHKERVLDDIFSGFQHALIPIDEMRFGNAYVYDWQAQDWIIRKRRVSQEEMEGKFGTHENWGHVETGVVHMLSDDGFYYTAADAEQDDMVEHVNYKHRTSDLELDFVNGVYLSNPNTEYNPFYHRRTKTVKGKSVEVPVYNTVKYGFEPIDAMRFIGYKSLVDKMSNDQDAADREWQDFFDASRLATFQPIITMGAGKIDHSVIAPSAVTEIGKDASIKPIGVSNPLPALNALREAEMSINESSIDQQPPSLQGGGRKTTMEITAIQQNIETNLTTSATMISTMVKQIGALIIDDIVRFQTIGEAGQLVGETTYRTFVVPNRVRSGATKSTVIRFTDKYAGQSMTKDEKDMAQYALMEEAGDDKELIDANPAVFARMNWLVEVDTEQIINNNDAFERNFKLAAYEKAMANPLVQQDPEAQLKITRDFLFEPIMKGEASKYLPNIQKVAAQVAGDPNAGGYPQNKAQVTKPYTPQPNAGATMTA